NPVVWPLLKEEDSPCLSRNFQIWSFTRVPFAWPRKNKSLPFRSWIICERWVGAGFFRFLDLVPSLITPSGLLSSQNLLRPSECKRSGSPRLYRRLELSWNQESSACLLRQP